MQSVGLIFRNICSKNIDRNKLFECSDFKWQPARVGGHDVEEIGVAGGQTGDRGGARRR